MSYRLKMLKLMYWLPTVIGVLRILLTIVVLVWNPSGLAFRYVQVIPMLLYCGILFLYLKMYSDSDPVITVLVPSILHFLIILVFRKEIQILQLLPLLIFDIAFLVVKGIKGSAFPFDIEEPDAKDDLAGFDESELEDR